MGFKKKHEEHENLERWLVSYADFVTLLFAFFTTMYALSLTDRAKYQNVIEAIQRAFLSAGGIFALKGAALSPFDRPQDKGSLVPSPTNPGKYTPSSAAEAFDRIAQNLRNQFEKNTQLNFEPGDLEILETEDGFKIRLGEKILFNPGSDKLRREYLSLLVELAKRLTQMGATIQVEGHADSSKADKNRWALSMSRAYHVVRFFVEGVGISPEKISAAGYGDTRPIADNDTPKGRARNRRVEIAVSVPHREFSEVPW